jgi:NAD(P)-dependent dehydrogenase (short-subunit alcohol dehydrogenase family)
MQALNDKVAIITGGGKGTGFGIARALIEEGVAVTITGRSREALDAAKAELEALAPDARVRQRGHHVPPRGEDAGLVGRDHVVPREVFDGDAGPELLGVVDQDVEAPELRDRLPSS